MGEAFRERTHRARESALDTQTKECKGSAFGPIRGRTGRAHQHSWLIVAWKLKDVGGVPVWFQLRTKPG